MKVDIRFSLPLAALLSASLLVGSPAHLPVGLSAQDWESVCAEHERRRHAAREVKGGYRARNHGQQWTVDFDRRGLAVTPDHAEWIWGLELASYGYPGRLLEVKTPVRTSSDVERVTYEWNGVLEEWFANEPSGLEHGFTLLRPPEGAGERVEWNLRVRGGLRVGVAADGRSAIFGNAVRYMGLKAWDADGRELDARMETVERGLRILVDVRDVRYPVMIDPVAQEAYIKASNTEEIDSLGSGLHLSGATIALAGDTLAVGAVLEDSASAGVNPDGQADNSSANSGAVYVFRRNNGVWSQEAYIKASNPDSQDKFGNSVALSGNVLAVGAPQESSAGVGVNPNTQADDTSPSSGAVYVFVRTGDQWNQQAYLKASNPDMHDAFGTTVALDGDLLAVGAPNEASGLPGVNPPDPNDDSTPGSGAVYLFRMAGNSWAQEAYIKSSNPGFPDSFGIAIDIYGRTLAVGAVGESSAGQGVNPDAQGDDSAFYSGAVYVFTYDGASWSQRAYLKASNPDAIDMFGVALSLWGNRLAIGAPYESSSGTGVNSPLQADNSAIGSGAV